MSSILGCSSAPTTVPGSGGASGASGGSGSGGTMIVDTPPPVFDTAPTGWAAVEGAGVVTTTGGADGPVVEVSTVEDLVAQVEAIGPRVVVLSGIVGDGRRVKIASNVTLLGNPGAEFHGGLRVDGSVNVIVRNLKVVGNNCSDSPTDCSGGADAITIGDGAHHVWMDHLDVSNGSDGNLDINEQADYITISWSKFSYSGIRAGGHQFSNLIGSGDDNPEDVGHLRVTWHHNWWADNARERMPRVRYGQVHLFNNLYTAAGNSYCIGLGFFANILTERNAFFDVKDPIESTSYSNAQSVVVSRDNLYVGTSGSTADKGTDVFVPPYPYALDDAAAVRAMVEGGAGPCKATFTATPQVSCTQ